MVQLGIRLFVPRFIVVYKIRLNCLTQGYAETLSWRGHLFHQDDKGVLSSWIPYGSSAWSGYKQLENWGKKRKVVSLILLRCLAGNAFQAPIHKHSPSF